MTKTVYILISLLLQSILYAQNLHFQSYSSAHGLSQNSIYSIAQTNEGFMWFGTQDGLNRFDGENFITIIPVIKDSINKSNTSANISKMITALYADANDWLWVGTTFELLLYNRYTNVFLLPQKIYTGFQLPKGTWITSIKEDNQHRIWILSQRGELFCYSKLQKQMIGKDFSKKGINNIQAISIEKNGAVWACSKTAVFSLDNNTIAGLPIHTVFTTSIGRIVNMAAINGKPWIMLSNGQIVLINPYHNSYNKSVIFSKEFIGRKYLTEARVIHQSDSNTVWIGSRSEGLLKINLKNRTFENAGPSENIHSLKTAFVLSFFTSNQNVTWIGLSGGGIAKYDLQTIQFGLWRNENCGNSVPPDNIIFSVFSQNDEDFYMGTLSGGLLHTNIKAGTHTYYQPKLKRQNESEFKNMYEIISGNDNLLWIASWGGLLSFDRNSKKFINYSDDNDEQTKKLCSIIKLKTENKLLVGGYEGGLRIFNLQNNKWEMCRDKDGLMKIPLFKLRVRYMKEMENGIIYMSTEANNLVLYNYFTGQFKFFPQFKKISGASRYFYKDSQFLWVATDDGLIQASSSTFKIIKLWTKETGLPNNYIYTVVPDNNSRLWVSSNSGLAMIDLKTGICNKYTEDDGLQSMEFNTASCFKDKKGNLWFGGINGLNKVNPDRLAANTFSPPPLITNIQVMNIPYITDSATPYLHNFTLPHTKNFISFEFQSPNFSQSENIIYQYKLMGVDTGWVNNGTKNVARYTQLKPGEYTFYVRSANTNYIWSKNATSIHLSIIPPWYNTLWFYFLLFVLSLTILYIFIAQRIKGIHYKAAVKQKFIETEMAALKAQMNPHFMFNCINSIDAFIQSNDKYNATLYLNKFAKLIRSVLESSKENVVQFSKDIETLKLYLELEELRNENKFTVQLQVDEQLLQGDYKVPPLIIQPFVENAILHGLRYKDTNDGILTIEINKNDNFIIYRITDNGVGRERAMRINLGNRQSFGMQISYDRIKLFNKQEVAAVDITDLYNNNVPAGTSVKVILKIV